MFVLLLIVTLLPIGLFTLKDASATIEKDIYHYARGSYDILLRPESSRSEIETQFGLVEENYLGISDGGITLEQWERVVANKEVEIAAPVAAIGLFTAPQVSYSLPVIEKPLHYTVNYTTTDGVHTYPLGEINQVFTVPDELTESGFTEIVNNEKLMNVFLANNPSFLVPPSYHQVVAIDPDQEKLLTNSEYDVLKTAGPSLLGGPEFTQIPILSLEKATTPIEATLKIDQITVTLEQVEELRENYPDKHAKEIKEENGLDYLPRLPFQTLVYMNPTLNEQLIEELSSFPINQTENYQFSFMDSIAPFYDNYIYLDEEYELWSQEEKRLDEIGGVIDSKSQEKFFQVKPPTYLLQDNGEIAIPQTGYFEDSTIPVHRAVTERSSYTYDRESMTVTEGDAFNFFHAGYFNVDEDDTLLAASPLGIYGIQKTHLADNPESTLKPTAAPGSFIATPAHGLVSIEWAEQIKGSAPIDAIRVKVSGITGYDVAASEKIKALAKDFEADGFTVDIVAGASHQSLTIDVEGIGEVVQPWTTLGAADTILQSWDLVSLVIVLTLFVVSVIYILFAFRNLIKEREHDEKMLVQLGWDDVEIRRLRGKELGLLIGVPLITGLVSLVIASIYLPLDGLIVLGLGVGVVLIVFASIGAWSAKKKEESYQRRLSGPLAIQNSWFYRHAVLIATIQVILMTIVSIFLTLMIQHEKMRTTMTTLGVYVHTQVEWYTIVLLAIIYLLTFITVIESLTMLWKQRESEFLLLNQIGWGNWKILQLYVRENMIWLGTAILIGTIVSIASYHWIVQSIQEQWGTIFGIVAAIIVAMAGLSIVVLTFFLRKVKLV